MKDYFSEEVKKTVDDIKNKEYDLCFAMLTDTRLCDAGEDTRENIGAVDGQIGFDFIVHLGNIINGDNPRDISMHLMQTEIEKYRKAVKSAKVFVAQGERDGYRDERFIGQLAKNIMYDELWYKHTGMYDEEYGISRPENKPYYYVDLPQKKVRLIVLCAYYSQYDEENGLYEKYTGIDTAQAAWLKNTALSVPAGTTVLIFSHAIPKSRFENGAGPFVYEGFSTEPILMILQNAQKSGIEIACWFGGGYNCDADIVAGGVNYAVISSQLAERNSRAKCEDVRVLQNRTEGTVGYDCWDAVSVNLEKREIMMHRFGCGEDRVLHY